MHTMLRAGVWPLAIWSNWRPHITNHNER